MFQTARGFKGRVMRVSCHPATHKKLFINIAREISFDDYVVVRLDDAESGDDAPTPKVTLVLSVEC